MLFSSSSIPTCTLKYINSRAYVASTILQHSTYIAAEEVELASDENNDGTRQHRETQMISQREESRAWECGNCALQWGKWKTKQERSRKAASVVQVLMI